MSIFNTGGYGYRPNRPRINFRIIIGLVIAAIGIFSYYNHTEVNPVTGEKQHVGMTVDQEMALGLQAAPQMEREMGGAVDENDPRNREFQKIGQELLQHSDAGKSPYVDNFHFHLLRDPRTINAFSLPGGQVYITVGLYGRLENEAQLAGVMGHEMGHVIERHGAQHMAKGQLGSMLVTAIGVGASNDRGRGQFAAIAAAMANEMMQLKYSRNDELQADAMGLQLMTEAGYDPREMRRVMEILKESTGSAGRGPNILQTHPDPDARIEQIDQYLKSHYPSGVPSTLRTGFPLKTGTPTDVEQ